jgi:hypothetical protein
MSGNARLLIIGALLLMGAWGLWQIYAGWGLVTINARDVPVSKVLASISRQGGIDIATDLDPATPVTLRVRRTPPVEALDIVAVRTDSSWRLTYLGAPDQGSINSALAAFRSGQTTPDWTTYGGGGGFNFFEPESGQALDLRRLRWEPSQGGALSDVLSEAAEKTGAIFATPKNWEAEVSAPAGGPLTRAAPRLFRAAGGVSREVFLLRAGSGGMEDEPGPGQRRGWIGAASGGGGGGGWMQALANPERVAQRIEAQIELLPAREQARAREDFEEMRQVWQSIRDLPPEQRATQVREILNRPEMMERMVERREAREAKMTPQQRIERSQRYWQRKMDARSGGGNR